MITGTRDDLRSNIRLTKADLNWPIWVGELLRGAKRQTHEEGAASLLILESCRFRFIRARVCDASSLSPVDFRTAVWSAYCAIARICTSGDVRFPVRFWNYIPSIHRPSGEGVDRYMVFNVGRYEAWQNSFGSLSLRRHLPTASAIGYDGEDLVIDALCDSSPGVAVENPRQIPSYRYTRQYGPRPPCFSRAAMLYRDDEQSKTVLIGGTASVVGQDSAHPGDLSAQIRETLANLSGLLGEIFNVAKLADHLRHLREVRVYFPRPEDEAMIRDAIATAFPEAPRTEFMRADLCRRELLVEIEGVAGFVPRELHVTASDREADRESEQFAERNGSAPNPNGSDCFVEGA